MSKNRARLSSNDKRDGIELTPLRGLRPLLTAQSAKNMRSVFNQSNN